MQANAAKRTAKAQQQVPHLCSFPVLAMCIFPLFSILVFSYDAIVIIRFLLTNGASFLFLLESLSLDFFLAGPSCASLQVQGVWNDVG